MTRRRKAEGDRSVNEADPCLRSSRARATTPSVDAPMNSTSLTSTMTPAVPTAMARASVRHSAPSFETSCSPQSRTTIGPISDSPWARGRSVRDGKERRPDEGHGVLLPEALRRSRYQGLEYRPSQHCAGPTRGGLCRASKNRTCFGAALVGQPDRGQAASRSGHYGATYGGTTSSARAPRVNTRREAPARLGTPACAGAVCRRPKQVMSKRRVGVTNGRTSLFVGAPEGTLPVSRFCPNSPGAINDHLPVGQERPRSG